MEVTGLDISAILRPVQQELERLEEFLGSLTVDDDYQPMASLLHHLFENRGKRLRPAILLAAAKLNRYDPKKALAAAAGVELLHTATLVHDDLVDGSSVRRGRPTINSITDPKSTVLIGDYLYAASAAMMTASRSLEVMDIFARAVMTLCQGQLEETLEAGSFDLSIDKYHRRIEKKTAVLFACSAETGGILTQVSPRERKALTEYGRNLGTAFQIVDDILDFTADERTLGKPVGSDLRQGIVTLPTILYLRDASAENPILAFFRRDGLAREEYWQGAVEAIRSSSSIGLAYEEATHFAEEAKKHLGALPKGELQATMADLADYVVARRY